MEDFTSIVSGLTISGCGIGDAIEGGELGAWMIWEGSEKVFWGWKMASVYQLLWVGIGV